MKPLNILLVAVTLLLGACSIQSAGPEKTTYQFGAARMAQPASAVRYGILRVTDFRVPQANRGSSLVYRETDQRFVADPYRLFLAPPAALMAERARAWLAASGLFRAVLPAGSTMAADATLEIEITELYTDVRDPKKPAAVLALRAWLADNKGGLIKPEWRFNQRIALNQPDAATSVAAYDQALAAALGDLETALAR